MWASLTRSCGHFSEQSLWVVTGFFAFRIKDRPLGQAVSDPPPARLALLAPPPPPHPNCESNTLIRATGGVVAASFGTMKFGVSCFWWLMSVKLFLPLGAGEGLFGIAFFLSCHPVSPLVLWRWRLGIAR